MSRSYRRGDTISEPAVLRHRAGVVFAVLTYPCCGCRTWVEVTELAWHGQVDTPPLVTRCGRRYGHRRLPGGLGCDWPWTITIHPAEDGITPATLTWTA